jgi:3'-5' exoribonuclease
MTVDEQTHLWVKDITENDTIRDCYLVKEKRMGKTRRGEPFMSLILADQSGEMEAKIWEGVEPLSSVFEQGDVVEVQGLAGSYRGQLQIKVSEIRPHEGEVDLGLFLEAAPGDLSEMLVSLREILRGIRNTHLKALVEVFLADHAFLSRFKRAAAAKNFHHCYLGGLLEHTLSVCQMAMRVTEQYPQLDRDLLLAGAFLHDIGKIRELGLQNQIEYTDEGRLLGHVILSAEMADERLRTLKGFPRDLAVRIKHLILSHHGQYEFGSPKRPKFLEAMALHFMDDLDAKINGLGRFMERDRQEGPWTDFNRMFERYFLKGKIGSLEAESEEESLPEKRQQTLFSV